MTFLNGIFKWIYDIGNWLGKLIFMHVLWVAFTLLGLVILGFMPATSALFAVVRKLIEEDIDTPIFNNFFTVYKSHFLNSNIIGLILYAIGAFLYFDIVISKEFIQSFWLHFFLLLISFLYVITLLYFFPVFVKYKLKRITYIKQSFFIALARPFETIAILICLFLLYLLFSYLPILILFAGSSLMALPIVWFANRAFIAVEEKKSAIETEST